MGLLAEPTGSIGDVAFSGSRKCRTEQARVNFQVLAVWGRRAQVSCKILDVHNSNSKSRDCLQFPVATGLSTEYTFLALSSQWI